MQKIERRDYRNIAKKSKVQWLGKKLPIATHVSTQWECLLCGRVLNKSYQRMKNYKNACRCRSNSIKTPTDYRSLAFKLSERFSTKIEFPEQEYPQNTYQKVIWIINSVKISETYHNLAYHDGLPKIIKNLLK